MPFLTCPECACEIEIPALSTERVVACPDCDTRLPVVRERKKRDRGARPKKEFDPGRASNRMWCSNCDREVMATKENSERFNSVFGVTWVVQFALGCGVGWNQLANGADWELVGFLFALYVSVMTYVCAMVAAACAKTREFRCKKCGEEAEMI